jgi:hypothetical protein
MCEILLNDLENIFYTVKPSEQRVISLMFVDFHHNQEENQNVVPGPDIFTKMSSLNEHIISEDFNKQLFDEYIDKTITLSKKNRETELGEKFDITLKKWEDEWKESFAMASEEEIKKSKLRKIISKLNSCSSYIAMNGRIGPAQFVITNQKTYDFLKEILDDYVDNLGNMRIHISDKVEDGDILLGRKNEIHIPGVILVIMQGEDKLATRIISEADPYGEEDWNDEGGKTIDIRELNKESIASYDFIEIGFFPEKQFYMIKIK